MKVGFFLLKFWNLSLRQSHLSLLYLVEVGKLDIKRTDLKMGLCWFFYKDQLLDLQELGNASSISVYKVIMVLENLTKKISSFSSHKTELIADPTCLLVLNLSFSFFSQDELCVSIGNKVCNLWMKEGSHLILLMQLLKQDT